MAKKESAGLADPIVLCPISECQNPEEAVELSQSRFRSILMAFVIGLGTVWACRIEAVGPEINPRYPRIGAFHLAGSPVGSSYEMLAQRDMVIMMPDNERAAAIKSVDPSTVVFQTFDWNWARIDDYPGPWYIRSSVRATTVSGSTTTTIRLFSGEGRKFYVDVGIAIGDEVSRVADVSGDVLTVSPAFSSAPAPGTTVTKLLREVWGSGSASEYMMDLSTYCPRVETEYGPMRFNEYWAKQITERVDYSVTDGVSFDNLVQQRSTWPDPNLDLDRNGVADFDEGAGERINAAWREGYETLFSNVRAGMPPSPHLRAIFVNGGAWWKGDVSSINGSLAEYWHLLDDGGESLWNAYQNLMANCATPQFILIAAHNYRYDSRFRPLDNKKYYRYMRYALTYTLQGNGYFHCDATPGPTWHSNLYRYDEFELDLGYPTQDSQQLPNGVRVRFFDSGVAITNPTTSDKIVTDGDLRGLQGYDGPYYRFRGGQDPKWNDGTLFTSVTLLGDEGSGGALKEVGDGIILLKTPQTVITPIEIDNGAFGTTPGSEPAVFVGSGWRRASGKRLRSYTDSNPHWTPAAWGTYHSAYGYMVTSWGTGLNTATYTPTIGVAGDYEVFEWHGWHGDYPEGYREASNVPYTITYSGGTASGTIDQTTNYGQWNSLGTYYFDAGTSGNVKITDDANGYVIADAFRFVYVQAVGMLKGDMNFDGRVDYDDFFLLAEAFGKALGEEGFNPACDLDENGRIDFDDFFTFAENFGQKR